MFARFKQKGRNMSIQIYNIHSKRLYKICLNISAIIIFLICYCTKARQMIISGMLIIGALQYFWLQGIYLCLTCKTEHVLRKVGLMNPVQLNGLLLEKTMGMEWSMTSKGRSTKTFATIQTDNLIRSFPLLQRQNCKFCSQNFRTPCLSKN